MDLLTITKEYWIQITAFVAIVISWANLKAQDKQQEKRIHHIETKMEMNEEIVADIKTSLATISNDIHWIKEKINNIK